MLNGVETAVGKTVIITHKADNTETVELRTIAVGKTAEAMGIIEDIKADIIAMTEAAESHGLKQSGFSVRERVFCGHAIVITTMTVV